MPDGFPRAPSSPGRPECGAILEKSEISKMGWGGPRANSGGARIGAGRKPNEPKPEPAVKPLGLRWYVVQTYSGAERISAVELTRQGWKTEMPLQEVAVRDRVTPSIIRKDTVPLLKGYIFVLFDRDQREWGTIRTNVPTVIGVVKVDGQRPSPVSEMQMERFRQVAARKLKLADPRNERRKVGALVRVMDGPFTSFPGVVRECDGLVTVVDVAIFGRDTPVNLRWDQVEAA